METGHRSSKSWGEGEWDEDKHLSLNSFAKLGYVNILLMSGNGALRFSHFQKAV